MKKQSLLLVGLFLIICTLLAAPESKTYQVTGPVLELNDKVIVVQKGDEKWQLGRDKGTRINGELKVGAKVTIEYRMIAVDVEVKGGADKGKK